MRHALKILALVFALTVVAPAWAQEAPAADAKASTVTVDQDALKKLITTLESETARTDFITNLKTLQETQADPAATAETPAEEAIAPLTTALGVETITSSVIDRYQAFLIRNDLKGSTVGRVIMTSGVLLFGALFIFLSRRGATKMLYWFDRAVEWLNLAPSRMRVYAKALRGLVTVGFLGLMLYTLTLIWDVGAAHNPFEQHWFRTALGLFVNIAFVLILATAAWEAINAMLAAAFKKADGVQSTRVRTIMPIVRNIVFLVFTILFSLVLLSEIGINITPLLAGAGVIGVAIGFGAQTMVKDFLSGFTLILEDVMRVGDVVKVNEFAGGIEKITLRKIQIRGGSGTVITIPFSAISIIQNLTKDFSTFEWAYSVPFDTDVEKVFATLRQVDEELRADPAFKDIIISPIDIWGVDGFTDSGMVIKGNIKTAAGKHWGVQREFNRRKAIAFNKAGIPNAAMPTSFQITEMARLPDGTAEAKPAEGSAPKPA